MLDQVQAGAGICSWRALRLRCVAPAKPVGDHPLGPLGFNFSQHMPTTRPSVERTAEKACHGSEVHHALHLRPGPAAIAGVRGEGLGVRG
jgi:hypothetical protein